MKKTYNLIIFIFKIYTFKFTNKEIITKFNQRLRKDIAPSIHEQILSNYYCFDNNHSEKYYFEKNSIETYKNFVYFIIALEDNDFTEYSNKAHSFYLNSEETIPSIPFFKKLEIIAILIFILVILISIYLNKKYIIHS